MADINLSRADLLQLEPISNTNTMTLLPIGKTKKQKLIVGDDSGSLGCYEFKRGETTTVFQCRPFEGPISCVALGGPSVKRDKIFASHGQSIAGVSKKGKEFFRMTSSLTEPIKHIATEDTRIWTGCEHVFNIYDSGKDIAFFMCRDQINSLYIDHISRDSDFDAVLACQDNCVRVINGSELFLEIPTSTAATVAASLNSNDIKVRGSASQIIYGMEDGTFGRVQVNGNGNYSFVWHYEEQSKRSSPVNCIKIFDVSRDGFNDMILGHDDGRFDIYSSDQGVGLPRSVYKMSLGESIRSVECGIVNSVDFNEVVIASYSGKILSFTSEQVLQRAADDSYGRNIKTVCNENRLKQLTKELDELKKKLEKERANVKKLVPAKANNNTIANVEFSINTKFILDKNISAYVLSMEIQSAMDLVIIRSETVLEVVDSDIGNSVISITPPSLLEASSISDVDTKYKFIAAFRCQGNERRLSVTLRPFEGESGQIAITVVTAAPKAAKLIKFALTPLSLHYRVHEMNDEEVSRPRHILKFSGPMTVAVVYDWILSILPDVPTYLPENVTEGVLYFKNCFTGAFSICRYRNNEIVFESESSTTIVTFKENLTKLANARRVKLDEQLVTNNKSIASYLSLIQSKLEYQLSLNRRIDLVDSIREITMQENDTRWLSSEYADIVSNEQSIRKEAQFRVKSLDYLIRIISDLFINHKKLQGFDARSKLAELKTIILSSNFDNLVAVFLENNRKLDN